MRFASAHRFDGAIMQRHATVIAWLILSCCCSATAADDWNILFDGSRLTGWKPFRESTQFTLADGVIIGTSSVQTHFLHTVEQYSDFELELEVKLHDTDLNSGIQIRTASTRKNANGQQRDSIHGPQVDIGKSPGRSGHIFNQGNGAWITPKEDLVRNELMVNGQWNKLRVLAVGPRIQTWINGTQVSDVTDEKAFADYPAGVIALQVHGVKKSPEKARHVSFRSIRVRRIKSAD